jgi:dimethylargininase
VGELRPLSKLKKQGIAITREISRSIENCELTHLERVPIDLKRARHQHGAYTAALKEAGWEVATLPEEPHLPDSVFVEDTAVILAGLAVITRPGSESRRPETKSIAKALSSMLPVAFISDSAILDGGDVLVVGKKIFVGQSSRSDSAGYSELRNLAKPLGYGVETIPVKSCLHLKSAVTAIDDRTLLLNPKWVNPELFKEYNFVEVHADEPAAANCVNLGEVIICDDTFPKTRQRIQAAGFLVNSISLDELAKAEGAATCCSLLIPQ